MNRSRGINFLREAAHLAKAIREEDAYITAVCDLSGLLMAPGRVSPADAAEAISSMSDAVVLARRMGNPSLGLLLTNLAECRMRASRDRQSLLSALEELREALPLRSSDLDRAYTIHNLGRVFFLLPENDPDVKVSNWHTAITYYKQAVESFRNSPDELAAFCRTVLNLAEVVEGMLRLDHALSVATSFFATQAGTDGTRALMQDVSMVYALWDLAQVNPSLLDGTDLVDFLTSTEVVPADQELVQKARDTLILLGEAQASVSRTSPDQWSSAQFWAASLDDRLAGAATLETARRREIGLEHCPMQTDPEDWCSWATAAMNSYRELGDIAKAIAFGQKAVDAYLLAMEGVPDPSDQRELTEKFHYLGRRVAFLSLSIGDADRALEVLSRTRGRSRLPITGTAAPVDAVAISTIWRTTLLYLVVGPDSTFFLAVDGNSVWKTAILRLDVIGGKQLIGLLLRFSPNTPGLLGAQNIDQRVLQRSLNDTFERLSPLMTALHDWLAGLGVGDVTLIPTGPYSMLPLVNVPVQTSAAAAPFGWLHRCSILPSAVSPLKRDERRDPVRSMLLAAEAIRPDLAKLRTRSECESIRNLSVANGWSTTLLLGVEVTSERLLQGTSHVGIIHYAGHAMTNLVDPEATALCLTDGDLNLSRFLEELTARPQMMVLSACQTGQSSLLQAPDENLGFASIAMDKGVAIVVGSLWPVADRETTKFMKEFYRSLFRQIDEAREISGLIVGEALVQAQRANGAPDYEQSRHWAAFQVFGL